jgi:hypothetical protein
MPIHDQTEFQLDDYGYHNITLSPKENVIVLDLVFFIFTATSIIFLNAFVVTLVLKLGFKKITKNPFNFQIMSLIITDFMVGVSLLPTQITYFLGHHSDFDCSVRCAVFMIAYMASLLHVCVICLDRWWIIYFNKTQKRKQLFPRCLFLLFGTWVAAFLIEFIPFVLWREENSTVCSIANVFGDYYNEAFGYQVCTHIAVISCITVFYGLIIGFILNKRKRLNPAHGRNSDINSVSSRISPLETSTAKRKSMPSMKSQQDISRNGAEVSHQSKYDSRQNKAIQTMGFIIGSHLLCVGPLISMLMMEIFGNLERTSVSWHHVVIYIACLGSAINPILYAFRIPEVNKAMAKFCRVNNASID